jgi:tetratricopeptide (TPR) repeat protein
MAITLPIILFLIDYLMYRKPNKQMFFDKIAFLSLSFIFGIITVVGKYSSGFMRNENLIVIPNKISIIVGSIVFYINKIFVPIRLSCSYPHSVIKNIPFLYSMVAIIILIVGIVISCKYTRRVVFGSMFFLATILPVLQVLPTSSAIVADRYIYIPGIGLFYIISYAFGWLYQRKIKNAIYIKSFVSLFLITAVCTLSYLTWEKCHAWKDSITLWNEALKSYPDISVAYNNRGNVYAAKGNHNQAILEYDKAIEINPNYAEAYNNRGSAYNKEGSHYQAISDYNKAIELNPNYADAYYNRGNAYSAEGNHDRAISDYNKAIELNPGSAEIYHNRGVAYGEEGNHDQAISDFSKAIELNPNLVETYSVRALAYCFKQEYTKAWDDVHKAETLGATINYHFLEYLKKASGNFGNSAPRNKKENNANNGVSP